MRTRTVAPAGRLRAGLCQGTTGIQRIHLVIDGAPDALCGVRPLEMHDDPAALVRPGREPCDACLRGSGGRAPRPATRVAVATHRGPVLLRPGHLDRAAEQAFRFGHCFGLALALHELGGGPVALRLDGPLPGGDWHGRHLDGRPPWSHWVHRAAHALVVRPDGRLLDIMGPQDPEQVLAAGRAIAGQSAIVTIDPGFLRRSLATAARHGLVARQMDPALTRTFSATLLATFPCEDAGR